jgi:hypothetical protein
MADIRIRQICLVAFDIERIIGQFNAVFGVEVCYRNATGFLGLNNCLIPFGSEFIEIVSPKPEGHNSAGERFLQRRGGDGGYMVISQHPAATFQDFRKRLENELGIRIVGDFGDGKLGNVLQLHPKDVPGAIAEFQWYVDEDNPEGPWYEVGPNYWDYKHTEIVKGIRAAEIQTMDPAKLATRWGEVYGKPVSTDDEGNPCLKLQNSEIRFVVERDGRGQGLGGLDLVMTDREQALANAEKHGCRTGENLVTICNMRLRLL